MVTLSRLPIMPPVAFSPARLPALQGRLIVFVADVAYLDIFQGCFGASGAGFRHFG